MAKYKIVYNKKNCVGAGECEKISKLWKVKNDGRAELIGSKVTENVNIYELIIDEQEAIVQKKVAGSCPVNAIKVEKISD